MRRSWTYIDALKECQVTGPCKLSSPYGPARAARVRYFKIHIIFDLHGIAHDFHTFVSNGKRKKQTRSGKI